MIDLAAVFSATAHSARREVTFLLAIATVMAV